MVIACSRFLLAEPIKEGSNGKKKTKQKLMVELMRDNVIWYRVVIYSLGRENHGQNHHSFWESGLSAVWVWIAESRLMTQISWKNLPGWVFLKSRPLIADMDDQDPTAEKLGPSFISHIHCLAGHMTVCITNMWVIVKANIRSRESCRSISGSHLIHNFGCYFDLSTNNMVF